MPTVPSPPARIVLCGDSVATVYGPAGMVPYPELIERTLRVTEVGGVVVRSRARAGTSCTLTIRGLDAIVRLAPTVVVLAHGANEAVLVAPPALAKVRHIWRRGSDTGQQGRRPPASPPSSASIRPLTFGPASRWALTHLVGVRPIVPGDQFANTMSVILTQLRQRTSALLVVVLPTTLPRRRTFLSPETLATHRHTLRQLASSTPNTTILDSQTVLTDQAAFAADGVHLTQAGHEAMASALVDALRPTLALR